MNTPLFIAKRIGSAGFGNEFTGLIKKIAILSISLGLAVMIISMAVVTGFQNEIRNKVIGFGGHIQITNYDYNVSFEAVPISKNQAFLSELKHIEGIRHIQMFATKPGIIKTDDDIHGVILKGIGPDFDKAFFQDKITEGRMLRIPDTLRSEEVIVSRLIANRLKLSPGDDVFLYFIQDPPRIRRLNLAGIYDTGLEELDRLFILGDIRHIQRLNDWNDDQIGGFEILVSDVENIANIEQEVLGMLPYHLDAKSIMSLYPQIFDWLALLDMNVYVIIVLMIMVAGINMVTTLLITVLEKTNAIGILKAVGGSNLLIRRVFLYHSGMLISRGLFWGNLAGILLCLVQQQFGVISLSPESYYVSEVPINLKLSHVLLLNAGTFITAMAMLIIPSYVVTRISPVRAISFR
ncbi:MAG: FtsX-like permease family protein [Bacteroidales bacterium]|nr:FtsX-like permease family protein [Bacteroidales bacterium]